EPGPQGCAGERRPHRPRVCDESRRNRSDHRGEGRGLRHEHLDEDVPRKLELQRGEEDRLELLRRAALVAAGMLALAQPACSGGESPPQQLVDETPAETPPLALEGVAGRHVTTTALA